ncbi:hypothetical protein HFU84_01270 [Acidithiobacillus sp. CV18-2]|uniref:Methionyl-tRNA formyltransferase n=1 Tax=Igneacidithiobacillus copahuensis TaxID=2724909 RepID=A0AAE3CKL1_9PROT|nr:hypothetical protein [Igneacidithiobacillus copahuensis]MBU2753350.1 hypothetical protein [Acidithiobacillus sp. CV18-3]MBU2756380.1 hypothetical protein [Acidithiobacillus sp. BN09-2]MBU2776167.1 hypothetical protein [Acidithiobacillus sp. CV18-2]MBU2795780.1 hypothetical protein [Acidithiobacillus sp. VAN18-2]MBU2798295.1 hypothetical protein [Acidithiobacillus sp. VAN18-4]UTV81673.1 hypothetical protein MQE22_03350 [Acidithiobacillus sp. YTS05]
MATVTKITHQALERESAHSEVECTYDVITDKEGHRFLQLDTYGSKGRQLKGKKSQSIRLSQAAIDEIKAIIKEHKL